MEGQRAQTQRWVDRDCVTHALAHAHGALHREDPLDRQVGAVTRQRRQVLSDQLLLERLYADLQVLAGHCRWAQRRRKSVGKHSLIRGRRENLGGLAHSARAAER